MQNYYNSNLSQMSYGNNNFGTNNNDYTNPFGVINHFPSTQTSPIQQSTLSNTGNYMSGYSSYQPFHNTTTDTSIENWPYQYSLKEMPDYCPSNIDNPLPVGYKINAIRNGMPLNLYVSDNPHANYNWPYYLNHKKGKENVKENEALIEKYANQYGVDPDLVKAVAYAEDGLGHKVFLNDLADTLHLSDSQMPMNVQGKLWSNFGGKQYDTYDPEQNIELGVRILKGISDSLYNPAPDTIGTLWNNTAADVVSDFGARVKTAYDTKSWLF